MKVLKTALLLLISICLVHVSSAQITQDPTTWSFEAKKKSGNQYNLIFHLKLKETWHIYSFNPGGDGMEVPPTFTFDKNSGVKLIGSIKEKGKLLKEKMVGIDGIVNLFKNKVDYIQTVEITGNAPATVTGTHLYQVCDDNMCLPPKTKPFSFTISAAGSKDTAGAAKVAAITDSTKTPAVANADTATGNNPATAKKDTINKKEAAALPVGSGNNNGGANSGQNKSLLWLFLAALGGGIAAVLTPCVYSMIPITVSFFTKRSKTRAEGIRNAVYYSLSIITIFTVLGIVISAVFGSNALNNLSTNWIANIFFFLVFIIFGISFLGAFEITLPSSWTNKTDSKANVSSFGGIFFMALTLVIVSFSCTGPIVGPLLVLAGRGGIAGPAVGMLGFSMGLALPFALFAVFPGMLNKMATSGGWLNQVKVVLGFIELGLALKFLSNADLERGWRLLDREIFIAIWIVLAVLLGIYLLGKLKLSHDDANPKNVYGQEYVSIFKLFLAIVCFTFSVYLLPGMWGAPLQAMSQFLPPIGTQDFVLGAGNGSSGNSGDNATTVDASIAPVKYVNEMRIYEPEIVRKYGLRPYYDYDEALAAAKKLKKPVMLDFTGINCVNCRKMESQVWSSPEVMKILKNDFIIASLYCDYDKMQLPANEQHFSQALQSQVVTVGDKNEDLQATKFNSNSQPYYFYVDENGNKLVDEGYSYNPDVQKFVAHLDTVKARYQREHQ